MATTTPPDHSRLKAALGELVEALLEELRFEQNGASGPVELLSVAEAATRAGIGRSLIYDLIGRGELRSIKISRRRLIPADAIAELGKAAR